MYGIGDEKQSKRKGHLAGMFFDTFPVTVHY